MREGAEKKEKREEKIVASEEADKQERGVNAEPSEERGR